MSRIIPISEIIDIELLKISNARMAPTSDRGRENIIEKGSKKDSNCEASRRYIKITANNKAVNIF
jgi:hypothetical protein